MFMARAGADVHAATAMSSFLQARLSRLYPLHLVMLLLFLDADLTARPAPYGRLSSRSSTTYHRMSTPESFVAESVPGAGLEYVSSLTWNGASWFVSVEFPLCLLFPLCSLLARGACVAWLYSVAAGIAGLDRTATKPPGPWSRHHIPQRRVPRHGRICNRCRFGDAVSRRRNRAARLPEWRIPLIQIACSPLSFMGDLPHGLVAYAARTSTPRCQ